MLCVLSHKWLLEPNLLFLCSTWSTRRSNQNQKGPLGRDALKDGGQLSTRDMRTEREGLRSRGFKKEWVQREEGGREEGW